MSPEFHGIHLLYLNSKIIALRVAAFMLLALLLLTAGFAMSQGWQIEKMQYDISEGNSVTCDEGYISKIVEGSRVSCVMMRIAPGARTYKQIMEKRK